nr:MAG TPA: hypothetical protein [Bacteriophage sp.]
MKSTDMDKVNNLLGEMDTLKDLIATAETFKDKELSSEIYCEGKNLWFGKDISKEVFNTILRELNTRKEKTIRELAELGVEYVE